MPGILPKYEYEESQKPPVRSTTVIISEEERTAGKEQIRRKITELGKDQRNWTPVVIIGTSKDNQGNIIPGTHGCSQSTIDRYRAVWNGLLDFAIKMKDYESGIILHQEEGCPPTPLPVSEELVVHYMRYKVMKEKEGEEGYVKHYKTKERIPIPGTTDKHLTSVGDWTSYSTLANL